MTETNKHSLTLETLEQIQPAVEALIFASGEPISLDKIAQTLGCNPSLVNEAIENLKARYNTNDNDFPQFGFELVTVNQQFQFRTKTIFGTFIQALKEEKPKRLSIAALETLAIIAYRQPIVKSEIESIRGVDATPTIKTLLERGIIKIVGHQSTLGNPALYGTTDDFLKLFSLGSLAELPTLREINEVIEEPGESSSVFYK